MDKKEFLKRMRKRRVPNYLFNIDGIGRDDERLCMIKENDKWNVYYLERGNKTTNLYFDSESEALEYMAEELSE